MQRILSLVLFLVCSILSADVFFIHCLESDSFSTASIGIRSFCKMADYPDQEQKALNALTRIIGVPAQQGIDIDGLFRVITAADTTAPLSSTNPSTLAILPLSGPESTVLSALASQYPSRTSIQSIPGGALFSGCTNAPFSPTAAIAFSEKFAMISPSPALLSWGVKNSSQLTHAPRQPGPDTFRILANGPRFAQLAPILFPEIRVHEKIASIISDFNTLLFSLSCSGEKINVSVRGTPRANSDTHTLASRWKTPTRSLWQTLPQNASFTSLSSSFPASFLTPYFPFPYSLLLSPLDVPDRARTGDHACAFFLDSGRKGLLFATVDQLHPHHGLSRIPSLKQHQNISFTPLPPRKSTFGDISRFQVKLLTSADSSSLAQSLLSLYLNASILECAIIQNKLFCVYGPNSPLIEMTVAQFSPKNQSMTLNRKINLSCPPLHKNENLIAAAHLSLVQLIHQSASLSPRIPPELLTALPQQGSGFDLSLTQSESAEVCLSLSARTDELRELKKAETALRPILQEIFLQILTEKLTAPDEATNGDPE